MRDPNAVLFRATCPEPQPLDWELVGGPYVEFKALELGLNYMEDMTRFQLFQPRVRGSNQEDQGKLIKRFLNMWGEVVTAAKTAQMNIELQAAWPMQLPWEIKELGDMPVTVWLRRQW